MRSLLVLCVALGVSAAATVRAQPAEPPMSARDHYRRGTQFYDLQRFDDAAREYEAAYQVKEDPAFLFNIGQAYRFAKKYDNAAGAFRSYLRRLPNAPNRPQVEGLLAELTKQAEEQKRLAEEQARAEAEQKRLAEEQARAREAAEAEARLRQVAPPLPLDRRVPDLAAAARGRKMKIVGIAVAAVGGVAIISGGAMLGVAGSISSKYNNLSSPMTFNPDDETRFRTFRLTGAVLVGVGGVAAVAGAVVAVLGSRREKENRVVWSPSVAPGYAGMMVGGGW